MSHLKDKKKVVCLLKDIIYLGLVYGAIFKSDRQTKVLVTPLSYGLIGYTNNNYTDDHKDYKLVMGNCFYINRAIMSWSSKKQQTISASTTEVEYIALRYGILESI